jgi:hypothetical protein
MSTAARHRARFDGRIFGRGWTTGKGTTGKATPGDGL